MKNRTLGSILIVAGTTLGAGMLAMPLASAGVGFGVTFGLLITLWALMCYTALLLLEVYQHVPADMGLAGVLGTAYAIVGGLDTDTALALAVPIGILGTIVWAGRMTFDCFFVHIADKYIEKEQYNKIWRANVLFPQIMCFLMTAIPCALAAYFGSNYIQGILNMLSGKVLTVFQIIGGLMPALGIAITLQYIFKGESKVFLFVGFLLAVYSKLPLLTLGIIALLVAVVYVQVTSAMEQATAAVVDDEDDEEDD